MTMLPAETETLMFTEAAEAPDVVARQIAANCPDMKKLGARLRDLAPRMVFTCARGSSDHAATFAKYLFETRLDLATMSQAPSISSIYRDVLPAMKNQPFLAISQSGQSPDLLLSAEAARQAGAVIIALVNDPNSPLAGLADHVIPLHAGPEKSVAATKSYLASLAALIHLATEWSGDPALHQALDTLPQALHTAWNQDWTAADSFADAQSLYVLGRGLTLGAAAEAALKFKETAGIHAEAFSPAEVLHGPMALVKQDFPVLVFAPQDGAAAGLADTVAKFADRGARIAVAGAKLPDIQALPLAEGLDPVTAPLAMVQSFYRLMNRIALARGLNPDQPPMLSKVTRTQ